MAESAAFFDLYRHGFVRAAVAVPEVRVADPAFNAAESARLIGTEHHNPDLQRFSLVASTYSDGTRMGAVGVIGPTRMRYSRAIHAVDSVSKAISRMVSSRS